MAQDGTTAGGSSYTIDNVTFPVGRTKLQSIFNAIRSSNIGNTAPDLVAGQFWIDNNTPSTTVWTLYLYDGTDNISFATIDTVNNTVNFLDSTFDLINDTTPQLGGNLASNGHDILFADNDKAIFGAGSDLQIYHDGSHSFIADEGTGQLTIKSNGAGIELQKGNSEYLARFKTDNAVELYYDNSKKFETTSAGVAVTGTLTTGAITSTGNFTFNVADGMNINTKESLNINIDTDDNDSSRAFAVTSGSGGTSETLISASEDAGVRLYYDNSNKFETTNTGATITGNLTASGNLTSLGIDDNATSTAITIDSSEQIGFGTSVPNAEIHISKSANGGNTEIILENSFNASGSTDETTQLQSRFGGYDASYIITGKEEDFTTSANRSSFMSFTTRKDGTLAEKMRITSTGSVGIGTSSIDGKLHLDDGTSTKLIIEKDGGGFASLTFHNDGTSTSYIQLDASEDMVHYGGSGVNQIFYASASERMRLTSTGLGILNSSPSQPLDVNGAVLINNKAGENNAALVINSTASGNSQVQFKQNGTAKAYLTYWDSSDTLALTDGSASGLHFSPSTQRVGIGTSAMDAKLHVDDSGGANVLITRTSTNQGIYFETDGTNGITRSTSATGSLIFQTNGNNERMRIDSSGRLNLGTTTSISGSLLNIDGGFINADVTDNSHKFIRSTTGTTGVGDPMICRVNTSADMADGFASVITFQVSDSGVSNSSLGFIGATRSGADNSGSLIFHTYNSGSQAEKLRIHPNGRQTFNHNSTASAHANFVGEVGSSYRALAFEHSNGGGIVGSVTTGSSSVAYNTSSDYRLKENVVEITDATTRLKQLKPKRFNFIADANTTVDGFIAHEVSSVVPEAITGTKDAVDADGNPEYQGIDQAKLVPLLVKTIQELEARITTLEANNP